MILTMCVLVSVLMMCLAVIAVYADDDDFWGGAV